MRDGGRGLVLYGASDEHQKAQVSINIVRRQLLQIGGLNGSRQGFVRVGAMEEREHAARGGAAEGKTLSMYAIFVDSQGLRYTIPHALAVTDGRV